MENFKIIALKLSGHPFLGDLTKPGLEFVTPGEEKNGPYSTVIIGPNGTGKSQLLRLIADIFEDLAYLVSHPEKKKGRLNYSYQLKIVNDDKTYLVDYKSGISLDLTKSKLQKLKKLTIHNITDNQSPVELELSVLKRIIPCNILANGFLVNDKFRFQSRNSPSNFYKYLGVRDTAGTARTRTFVKSIISFILQEVVSKDKMNDLRKIISYIGYDDQYLMINYMARYKQSFFTGNLTVKEFSALFDDFKKFSNRDAEPYGVNYYKNVIKNNADITKRIVALLNELSVDFFLNSSKKNKLAFNILTNQRVNDKLSLFEHLLRLDLIASPSIAFRKKSNLPTAPDVEVEKFSSGEFQLLASLIALRVSVTPKSLVLIDEPEISLHPNWQMSYVDMLKQIFDDTHSIHFIIATHSHFIISDLKKETSEIIKLDKIKEQLVYYSIKGNTFGQSAENILYNVFGLRTTRNHYFEMEIRKLLSIISGTHKLNNLEIQRSEASILVNKLKNYALDEHDPLNLILAEANEFIQPN